MFWKVEDWSNFHILTSLLVACLGAFFFTLIEYILHYCIWYLCYFFSEDDLQKNNMKLDKLKSIHYAQSQSRSQKSSIKKIDFKYLKPDTQYNETLC